MKIKIKMTIKNKNILKLKHISLKQKNSYILKRKVSFQWHNLDSQGQLF